MPKYLTVAQLQNYAEGIDLSAVPYNELLTIIAVAEAHVDTYCATEHQPRAWFQQTRFEGIWKRIPLLSTPASVSTVDRVFIQTGVQGGSGALIGYTVDPSTVQVDNDSDWVQLTTLGVGTPNSGFLGGAVPLVQVDYHTAWYLTQFGEVLRPDSSNKVFSGQRAFWAATVAQAANIAPFGPFPAPAIVYVNGVVQGSGYTIDYANGIVTFAVAQSAVVVTADYTYTIPDGLRDGTRLTATALLGERAANAAGMAGFGTLGIAGQLTANRRAAQRMPPEGARALLRQYRNPGII